MKALVIFSGGQDSTVCLYWARDRLPIGDLHAVTFDYVQRHSREIEAAKAIATLAQVTSHEVVSVGRNILVGSSPLVNPAQAVGSYASVQELPSGVEPTFVPGRNMLFLVLAANRAMALGVRDIVIGVCEDDNQGYPDCRKEFLTGMQYTLSLAMVGKYEHFKIHTPLILQNKKRIVQMAHSLPGCWDAMKLTHTCYNNMSPPCGTCHACLLRAQGFAEAGHADPLLNP